MADPQMSKYSIIILDEVHERSLHTDILLGLLKKALPDRPELKVIVMSATLQAEKFVNFFGTGFVVYAQGRQYPVEMFYTYEPQTDYLDSSVVTTLQLHIDETLDGDILLFLVYILQSIHRDVHTNFKYHLFTQCWIVFARLDKRRLKQWLHS